MAAGKIGRLRERIQPCTLCPRECGVDRTAGETGACRIGERARVASAGPHFGEEPVLVGRARSARPTAGGSGTIFFSGCNLDCVFCQNFDISHSDGGREVTPGQIAEIALELAGRGCENINFSQVKKRTWGSQRRRVPAPKGRNVTAQGNALGNSEEQWSAL